VVEEEVEAEVERVNKEALTFRQGLGRRVDPLAGVLDVLVHVPCVAWFYALLDEAVLDIVLVNKSSKVAAVDLAM
jgi:hypothetical protein